MSNTKNLIARIREYEASSSVSRKTNERVLPALQSALSDLDRFNFGMEDLDLKKKMEECAVEAKRLKFDNITPEQVESLRSNINYIQNEIERRYTERMESHASRRSNI